MGALRKVGGMSSGPAAPLLRMACMAMSSSRMVKGEQQDSAAVVVVVVVVVVVEAGA